MGSGIFVMCDCMKTIVVLLKKRYHLLEGEGCFFG